MGFLLGLSSAASFAAGAIWFKIGQREHALDNGLFASVLVNALILGGIVLWVDWPTWSIQGFLGLVAGGLLGSVAGRSSNLKAIRLIGPSRANAFLTGNPVVAAALGWLVLGERLGIREFVGGALVVVGLVWLVRARSTTGLVSEKPPVGGYFWAVAALTAFGSAFVVRKWALELYPGALTGAFIGSASALVFVTVSESRVTSARELFKRNLIKPPLAFVAAGIATTVALILQFFAFGYLPAWVVSILQGTQVLWTLLFSWMFLRAEESLHIRLVAAVAVVVLGVVFVGLEV